MDFYRQSIVYSPRGRDHRRRSPRLPTPEASRSSNGSLDEQVPRAYTRNEMRICSLLTNDQPDHANEVSDRTLGSATVRSDNRHHSAPQSPPYQAMDNHKPSLPPLKTVLHGAITSPPDTPPHQSLFQSGPREPAFSAWTYKPPALYPNKKPRTEGGLDPSPTFNPRSSLSSPGLPTAAIEPQTDYSAHRLSVSHGPLRSYSEHENSRRRSMYQVPVLRQEQVSPTTVNYQYGRGFADDSRSRQSSVITGGSYRPSEAAPYSSSRSEPFYAHPASSRARPSVDYYAPSSADRYALPSERAPERRSSAVSQQGFAPVHPLDAPRVVYPPTRPPHYSLPMREDSGPSKERSNYVSRDRSQPSDVYSRMGYEDAQPTFFMPSHYDYQQGKTRKRSNLPKQSTEIMKTWFDQNITNPYPSEEQKAIFSNATGISMTQVSNWFINHRRRCPELRDKRDRTRVSGLDGSD